MTPELRLIRYFVAVAEEGNVTRAAQRLHMAQPPLSAAIRQLEDQLGVRLLDRTTRGVALTAAGELLLERGRALLREADAVAAAVRAVEQAPSGLVSVGLSPAARVGLAPALLEGWAAGAPARNVHPPADTTRPLLREIILKKN
jgi:DNA-binding transcriptional LysR family regulator